MITDITNLTPSSKILLIGSPPMVEEMWEKERGSAKLDRDNNSIKTYVKAMLEVGAETDIPTIDSWDYFKDVDLKECFYDGLHFSQKGHFIFGESLCRSISRLFPDMV